MKWLELLLCFFVLFIGKAACIKNFPADKNLIPEEDRRAAEKLSDTTTATEHHPSETNHRGLDVAAVFKGNSPIEPGIRLHYQSKNSHSKGYGDARPVHVYEERPPYPSGPSGPSGSRGGYYGHHYSDYGGYGHSGEIHSHSGGVVYGHHDGPVDYPEYGHSAAGHYGGGGGGYKSPFALKALLLPLAGIALLGAAAALSANPVLLQLGAINGRRRRRGLPQENTDVYPPNHIVKPDKK